MDKSFMEKAEKKFIFAAFCLVMKDLKLNPEAKVYLPILLDATCSGIQHLAALIKDFVLGSKVNLIPQKNEDNVADIYNTLVSPINNAINKKGEEIPEFTEISLKRAELSRFVSENTEKTYVEVSLKECGLTIVHTVTISSEMRTSLLGGLRLQPNYTG